MKIKAVLLLLGNIMCSQLVALTSGDSEHNFIIHQDVEYGKNFTQSGYLQSLRMDIYVPNTKDGELYKLIVVAHGGYFLAGDKSDMSDVCDSLAQHGFVVANINYRLIDVKETDWSYRQAVVDAVYDMKAAVRFFRKDFAGENLYPIDTSGIFISGYSAGAITALHYAYINTLSELKQIGGEEMITYCEHHQGLMGDSGNSGYSAHVHGVINIAGSLQNANLIQKNEPPLISAHGTNDFIVPYKEGVSGNSGITTQGSFLLHQEAERIGLKNQLITLIGGDHFSFFSCADCIDLVVKFVSAI